MLKEPKTFDRPRMYYQPGYYSNSNRIRIIYPNGKAEFMFIAKIYRSFGQDWHVPCWLEETKLKDVEITTGEQALKLMQKYDKIHRWKKAQYLGEI